MATADECLPYFFSRRDLPHDSNCPERLYQFLDRNSTVQFLRLQWQDYSGVLRARIVVVAHYRNLTASQRSVRAPPIGFHCIVDNTLVPWTDPTGAHLLLPDYTSVRLLPGRPRYALLMCGIVETHPAKPPANSELCPRRALANVMHTARENFGVDFRVGFEVELEVLRRTADGAALVPFSSGLGRFAAAGLRDPGFSLVEEVVQTLLASGVGVETIQTEGRRGQYEISLGPQTPLAAIDELVLVHDTLKDAFSRKGYVVTMSPKPVSGRRQAIGQHTHLSMHSRCSADPDETDSFLAGILRRLPMLCAVCLPYALSYERVQPYLGGDEVAWGTENRCVPIRQIRRGHWELRCVDATANMYLALATVLSAGLLGLRTKEPLRWRDTAFPVKETCHDCVNGTNGINGVNGTKQTGKMAAYAPRASLPRTLEASLDELEHGGELEALEDMMGSRALRHYIAVKRLEAKQMQEIEPQMARDLLSELF